MAQFFHEGGGMMFVAVVSFLGTLGLIITQAAIGGRRNLIPFIVAAIVVQILIGALGTVIGYSQALGVTAAADPSMKTALLAQGASEAFNNIIFAIALAIFETLIGTFAVFRFLRSRKTVR